MNKIQNNLAGLLLVLFSLSIPALASDVAKEKRWANDIVGALIDGEAVWLTAEKQPTKSNKFLGIYTESSEKKIKGAAIVLHGIGVHPNWTDVVYPLRVQLPEHGWHTLSLQMPILRNQAEYDEYKPLFVEIAPRMNAGIKYLQSKGVKNIVIVGHSLGSTMASYYLAEDNVPQVSALVAVGVSGIQFGDPGLGFFNSLTKLKLPILDIFGTNDIEPVLSSYKKRAAVAKKSGNKRYTQIIVKGADHFFAGKDESLVKNVSEWLDTTLR